jgi:hypothetical protein
LDSILDLFGLSATAIRGTGQITTPHQSTVDWDHRTGHIIEEVGCEELDDFGAIVDRPKPPQRHQLGTILFSFCLPSLWFTTQYVRQSR